MATVIECDGIRVEGENERAALRALKKAKADADKALSVAIGNREAAREKAYKHGWRILSAYLSDGGLASRNMAWCDVNTPCGPLTKPNDDGGVNVLWQAANGDAATISFYVDPVVLGGLCDCGGWLIAIRTKDEWLAIGEHCGQVAWERLPEGFKPELP